jgi:hypothetical protein
MVKVVGKSLVAISAQPTFEFSTAMADDVRAVEGKLEALAKSEGISTARMAWLSAAIPKVDAWLSDPNVLHILNFDEAKAAGLVAERG